MDMLEMKKKIRFICKKYFAENYYCSNFNIKEIYIYLKGYIDACLEFEFGTFEVVYRDILGKYLHDYLIKLDNKEYLKNAKEK